MIPVGLASATNFFTGKYIGANLVPQAKKISQLCLVCAFAWSILTMGFVGAFRDSIQAFYTKEQSVKDSMT